MKVIKEKLEAFPLPYMGKKVSMKSYQKGFTLIELLIVMAIIALLAVLVLVGINPAEQINKAQDAQYANMASEVAGALDRYYASNTAYPWGTAIASGATTPILKWTYANGANTSGINATTDKLFSSNELKTSSHAQINSYGLIFVGQGANDAPRACYVPKSLSGKNGILSGSTYQGLTYMNLTQVGTGATATFTAVAGTSANCVPGTAASWAHTDAVGDVVCVLCI